MCRVFVEVIIPSTLIYVVIVRSLNWKHEREEFVVNEEERIAILILVWTTKNPSYLLCL